MSVLSFCQFSLHAWFHMRLNANILSWVGVLSKIVKTWQPWEQFLHITFIHQYWQVDSQSNFRINKSRLHHKSTCLQKLTLCALAYKIASKVQVRCKLDLHWILKYKKPSAWSLSQYIWISIMNLHISHNNTPFISDFNSSNLPFDFCLFLISRFSWQKSENWRT